MQSHDERQIHELFIQTSAEKLWQSLTDGTLTPSYFFGSSCGRREPHVTY